MRRARHASIRQLYLVQRNCAIAAILSTTRRQHIHHNIARHGFQRISICNRHTLAAMQNNRPHPRINLSLWRIGLRQIQSKCRIRLTRRIRHISSGNIVVIINPRFGINPPGNLHLSIHRRQRVVLGLHRPNIISRTAKRLSRISLDPRIHEHWLAIQINHHMPDIIVIVTLGIVPALCPHKKSIYGSALIACDKHLNLVQKHITRQRLHSFCIENLIQRKQRGQRPPHAPKRLRNALPGSTLLFCSPRAKSHHRVIPNALAIAIDNRKSRHHHRRRIGKIDKISIRNLYPIDKLANILNERLIVHINRPTRCTVKPLQTIVKRCSRTPPIARPLVTPSVLRIRIDKMIHRLHRLKHRRNPTRIIGLHQQSRSQPIRHNPRIPIVHARTRIPHPAKIFPFQQRRQNAILHLARNARHNQRRYCIELRAQ